MTPEFQEIRIRPMTADDLDAVLAIEQRSFPRPWTREHFLHELTAATSFPAVASCGGDILGYICLMAAHGEAEILDIAVAPEARGRRVGATLLEWGLAKAAHSGAERVFLEVRTGNTPAVSLYRGFLFQDAGLRKNYYEGREDALIMELRLSHS